jgi:L-alanine-DL-glutamate epimerase-like enolase superfamily enzyme
MVPAGGIKAVTTLAEVAEEAGVSVAHHCGFDLGIKTAAVLHVVASHHAFDLMPDTAYFAMEGDVVTDPFMIKDGAIEVPDGPGLGVDIDYKQVDEYRL